MSTACFRGLDIMEGLFPGLTGELVAGGAGLIRTEDVQIYIKGWRKHHDSPLKVVTLTRPFLEWTLANRVRALAVVAIADGSEAVRLEGSADCVSGVTVRSDNGEHSLAADFIVDARGRASNLADWMRNFDMKSPPHETSPLGSVYFSCLFEPASSQPKPVALQIVKFEDKLGALVFQVEGGRVLLSVGANANVAMPKTHDEMLELLKGLPVPDAYFAIKDLKQITPFAYSRFTASVRRNFDALDRLPVGIVGVGDAVASFNPIFGQGMTVAALEAEWLGQCLDKNEPSSPAFAKAYYAGIKLIVDLAWGLPDLGNPPACHAALAA